MKKRFLWGAATSAHQVEGGNFNNDWWEFEQSGNIADGSSSHPSCDHYRYFQQDIDNLASLGCNAYRFSIEWSRVQPDPHTFAYSEIDHYHDVLTGLLDRQIEPVLTLHHFTNPLWLAKIGGWENPSVVDSFGRYVQRMVDEYSDKVKWWVTINEPNVFLILGYLLKYWPPQKRRNFVSLFKSFKNMVAAHKLAYQIIHTGSSEAKVSIAHHMSVLDPWRDNILDHGAVKLYDWCWNQALLNKVLTHLDYIGVNYYTRQRVAFPLRLFPTPGREAGFAQWEICPEGLLRVLRRLSRHKLPLVITEFGMPQQANISAGQYLEEGIMMVRKAIAEHIDLRGFFYWSLLDNFEWREGLSYRFGLYEVNYQTQKRQIRKVGERYKKLIEDFNI